MVSPLARNARINRTKIAVMNLHDRGSDVRFWRRQPVAKRLEGVELLRQTAHAYDPAAARLPRLLALRNKRASGRQKDLADVEALTVKPPNARRARPRQRQN
jgi:hypothetical protein